MVDQWIMKILLFPLAMLYGLLIAIRNGLYNAGLLRGVSFSLPVISIGNLSVGGTGKTPHVEYLVRLLHEYIRIGILSRGYKRKTTGYREINVSDNAEQAGDEPLQFKRKFPHVAVGVAESRGLAIPLLIRSHPETQLILLDDGFQHREVEPGLNILLTDYNNRFTKDWLLPVGRLREWRSAASRADSIIVTKCPEKLTGPEMEQIRAEVLQDVDQKVFFTHYVYGNPYRMYNGTDRVVLHDTTKVLLVTGIADATYLLDFVRSRVDEVRSVEYGDHHPYSNTDIADIERHFKDINDPSAIILTTEKDAMRLDLHRDLLKQLDLPVYLLPVQVRFVDDTAVEFDQWIKDWLLNFKR